MYGAEENEYVHISTIFTFSMNTWFNIERMNFMLFIYFIDSTTDKEYTDIIQYPQPVN